MAAHHFINYLLDPDVAARNFFYTGYQPPQKSIGPERVVADGYVPAPDEDGVYQFVTKLARAYLA